MRPHTNALARTHTYVLKLSVLFVATSYICSITFCHFNVYLGLSPCKRTSSGTEAKTCFLPFRTLSLFKDAPAFRWCGSTCPFYILNTTQICWFHTSLHSFCLACAYHLQYVSATAKNLKSSRVAGRQGATALPAGIKWIPTRAIWSSLTLYVKLHYGRSMCRIGLLRQTSQDNAAWHWYE